MPYDGCVTLAEWQYDAQRTSISKLQAVLFQPSKQIEVISASENKQITAWGDTRNKADHGRFSEITHTEVVAMVMGVARSLTGIFRKPVGCVTAHLPRWFRFMVRRAHPT